MHFLTVKRLLDAFAKRIFPISNTNNAGSSDFFHSNLKILTLKQMLVKRLSIVFVQVKAGNTSENLLNEIRQIIYVLYRAKKFTKNVYSNIMDSIKL